MIEFHYTAQELANFLSGELLGNPDIILQRINKIEEAAEQELSFLASPRFQHFLQTTHASCILIRNAEDALAVEGRAYILVADPHRSLVQFIKHLQESEQQQGGFVHQSVVRAEGVFIAASARVEAGVVIGEDSSISEACVIHANTVIGKKVRIGKGSVVYPNVTLYDDTVIGEHCIIHAGAVIGSDGFGYLGNADGSFEKIPQIGNVVIEDDVEIGANACIDRAALGSTRIGKGVKIDNLVHLAHNVAVGNNTAIAAQAGIAGGTKLGERNRIAGQVGMVGYITTADDVTVGAQAGVSKSITKKGEYSGSPAVELMTRLKHEAALRSLPKELAALKEEVKGKG